MIYLSFPIVSGIFKKPVISTPITEEEIMRSLNITVMNPTQSPEEIERQFAIDTLPKTVIAITPTPEIETIGYDFYTFGYSYYYPDLGGVNCHEDNWNEETQKCADTTASEKSWRENMGRGVALHYDILFDLPFGTIIEVLSPEEVKGFYEVIDICPGCQPRNESQPYFIDFLDDKQRLNWGDEIKVRVRVSE